MTARRLLLAPTMRDHADRWRRYRARQRNGVGIAPVAYDDDVIRFLVRTRHLPPDRADDRNAIAAAIARLLADAARRK